MEKQPERVYDELLVLRAQNGDADAVAKLVSRWHPRLMRHAWHLVERDDVAADLVQDSWLAIVRGIGGLEDPASFPKWAFRIVSNKCVDWTRRQSRQRTLSNDFADRPSPMDGEPSGESADLVRLRAALQRMPSDRRVILAMYYQDNMSIAEIAHAMNIPAGTVKSRLFHARKSLREVFERIET